MCIHKVAMSPLSQYQDSHEVNLTAIKMQNIFGDGFPGSEMPFRIHIILQNSHSNVALGLQNLFFKVRCGSTGNLNRTVQEWCKTFRSS